MGHKMAEVAVTEYASKVISKLISNSESWIDLTEEHINELQNIQDNYFKDVFHVRAGGTPLCMIRLDSQTQHIKWQELLKKIKQVHETMDKSELNICKGALIAGQYTCPGEDLLNTCREWCNKLNIRCVTMGTDPIPAKARSDEFNF